MEHYLEHVLILIDSNYEVTLLCVRIVLATRSLCNNYLNDLLSFARSGDEVTCDSSLWFRGRALDSQLREPAFESCPAI